MYSINSALYTKTKKGDEEELTRIFIGNIPFSATETDLKKHFASLTLLDVEIVRFKDKRSKGFGFANVGSDTEAEQAIGLYNGKPCTVGEVTRNLIVAKAK